MEKSPYSRFCQEEMILRDLLAVDRTVMANERTLLAYVRTALALIVIGVTFLHFLESAVYIVSGYAMTLFGAVVLLTGALRFFQVRRDLAQARVTIDRKN